MKRYVIVLAAVGAVRLALAGDDKDIVIRILSANAPNTLRSQEAKTLVCRSEQDMMTLPYYRTTREAAPPGPGSQAHRDWVQSLKIDFKTEMVVAVFKGKVRGAGNVRLAVTAVKDTGKEVQVQYEFTNPSPDQPIESYPSALAVVARSDLPVRFIETGAASQPASAGDQVGTKTLVRMHQEAGWGMGTVRTFVLNDDGTFTWVRWQDKTSAETLAGTLPKEKVQALMDHLAAAGAGRGAKDAGSATFDYVDSNKAICKKAYMLPSKPPCSDLLTEIDLLSRSHGKAPGAATQSQPAASQPATRPLDANAVAELIRQLGHEDYKVREEATKNLAALGQGVCPLLKTKLEEPNLDPEIATRIRSIVEMRLTGTAIPQVDRNAIVDRTKYAMILEVVDANDKLTRYAVKANGVSREHIARYRGGTGVSVTGSVEEEGGLKIITPTRIELLRGLPKE